MADSEIKFTKPKKVGIIRIGGVPITIKTADTIVVKNGKEDECWGVAHWPTATVAVSRALSKENREVVLLHEMIHIISSMHGLGLNEQQVDRLSLALNEMEYGSKWRKLVHGN